MDAAEIRALILNGTAPSGLSVNGDLNLSGCASLAALPEGLSVGGCLYLNGCTRRSALPETLSVGMGVDLRGCTALLEKSSKAGVEGWCERNRIVPATGKVVLFKRTSIGFLSQDVQGWGTKWEPGTTVEHPHWDPGLGEFGAGVFQACSKPV